MIIMNSMESSYVYNKWGCLNKSTTQGRYRETGGRCCFIRCYTITASGRLLRILFLRHGGLSAGTGSRADGEKILLLSVLRGIKNTRTGKCAGKSCQNVYLHSQEQVSNVNIN